MNLDVSSRTKFQIFRGSAPDPTGGAYSAPTDPLAGGEGDRCPLLKNSIAALSPQALFFIIFKHSLAMKRSWKITRAGRGKSWIFLSVKEWEPCI